MLTKMHQDIIDSLHKRLTIEEKGKALLNETITNIMNKKENENV